MNWSTPDDIRASVQREWDSGRLLAARVPIAEPTERPPATCFPLQVRLRRPTSADLAADWERARDWAAALAAAGGVRLETREVPSRTLGRQRIPVAAWVDDAAAALRMIGRSRVAARFDALVAATPLEYHGWVARKPHTALALADDWPALLAVVEWLRAGGGDLYLRQVDLPGVHTKVIERHRRVIAELAEHADPGRWPVTTGPHWFTERFGLRRKPAMVRARALDPACALIRGVADLALPVADLAAQRPHVQRVLVTENEVNFLSFPDVRGGMVLFGGGNEAPAILGALPWLEAVPVAYWGDIDTHGFAILDRVRARVPHVTSLLMDRDTLLTHRDAWVEEPAPTRVALEHLTDSEAALYEELRSDSLGHRVRLEQEHVRFGHVLAAAGILGDR